MCVCASVGTHAHARGAKTLARCFTTNDIRDDSDFGSRDTLWLSIKQYLRCDQLAAIHYHKNNLSEHKHEHVNLDLVGLK